MSDTQPTPDMVEKKPTEEVLPKETEDKKDLEILEEDKPVDIPQEDYRVSPLFYEVANYFGLEEREYEQVKDKLSIITEWAIMEAKSNKVHDLLPVIRNLEEKLARPTWGETRYNNLYRYIRLAMKRDAFDKALGAFEKMGGKQ